VHEQGPEQGPELELEPGLEHEEEHAQAREQVLEPETHCCTCLWVPACRPDWRLSQTEAELEHGPELEPELSPELGLELGLEHEEGHAQAREHVLELEPETHCCTCLRVPAWRPDWRLSQMGQGRRLALERGPRPGLELWEELKPLHPPSCSHCIYHIYRLFGERE